MSPMEFLIVLGLLGVVGIMFFGGYSMARGGEYDDAHAFEIMEARVIAQGITVWLILIALLFW